MRVGVLAPADSMGSWLSPVVRPIRIGQGTRGEMPWKCKSVLTVVHACYPPPMERVPAVAVRSIRHRFPSGLASSAILPHRKRIL